MLKHSLHCAPSLPLSLSFPLSLPLSISLCLHFMTRRPYQQLFLFTAATFPALIESSVEKGQLYLHIAIYVSFPTSLPTFLASPCCLYLVWQPCKGHKDSKAHATRSSSFFLCLPAFIFHSSSSSYLLCLPLCLFLFFFSSSSYSLFLSPPPCLPVQLASALHFCQSRRALCQLICLLIKAFNLFLLLVS